MLKKVKTELFWFVKKDAQLDLEDPLTRQMYVQQVLTRGRSADIRELIHDIGFNGIRESFEQVKRFIPIEVRMFWEDFFADRQSVSDKTS